MGFQPIRCSPSWLCSSCSQAVPRRKRRMKSKDYLSQSQGNAGFLSRSTGSLRRKRVDGPTTKDGTRIEILQLPLDRSTHPVYDLTQSQGRFIAIYREFLDPATIPPGTRITVTGEISRSMTLPLDETDYTYPVLNINRVQVWPTSENMPTRMRPYMGPGSYWGPYWGPYWSHWPYYW